MTLRSFKKPAALSGSLIALATLGGCVIDAPQNSGYRVSDPTAIEGNWRSADNIYTASFFNQSTTWTDIQTGGVLIRGTYTRSTQNDYSLTLNSATTGAVRDANCRVFSGNQLNCIYGDGTRFQMFRNS